MFKKFLALSSAVFVAAAGFTAVAVTSASADVPVLSASSTIKGVAITTGTGSSQWTDLGSSPVDGSVTLTSAQASNSSLVTSFVASTGTIGRIIHCPWIGACDQNVNPGNFSTATSNSDLTASLSNRDFFLIQVASGSNVVYYQIDVTVVTPTKTVSVGNISAPLVAGTGSTSTFNVTTSNIADGMSVNFSWYDSTHLPLSHAPSGITISGTAVSSNSSTVTVTTTNSIAAATYFFVVIIDSTFGVPTQLTISGGAPVISTTSTIASGASNPTVTLTFTGNAQANPSAYSFNAGTTGLTLQTINTAVSGTAVLGLHGTAAGGTLTIQMQANAFAPSASAASNTLSIVVPGGSSQQNSQQNSQQSTIDAAQAAAVAAAKAKAAAQSTLVTSFAANKPVKVTDFAAAGIPVASPTALTRVTADIANLPAAQRTDLAAIAKVVQTENFVDKVATPATHKAVTTVDLVQQGLVDPSNPNKASIVIALQKADPSTLTSLADIQAKIKAAMDAVAARKARTAAIIAKIEGRTATK